MLHVTRTVGRMESGSTGDAGRCRFTADEMDKWARVQNFDARHQVQSFQESLVPGHRIERIIDYRSIFTANLLSEINRMQLRIHSSQNVDNAGYLVKRIVAGKVYTLHVRFLLSQPVMRELPVNAKDITLP